MNASQRRVFKRASPKVGDVVEFTTYWGEKSLGVISGRWAPAMGPHSRVIEAAILGECRYVPVHRIRVLP